MPFFCHSKKHNENYYYVGTWCLGVWICVPGTWSLILGSRMDYGLKKQLFVCINKCILRIMQHAIRHFKAGEQIGLMRGNTWAFSSAKLNMKPTAYTGWQQRLLGVKKRYELDLEVDISNSSSQEAEVGGV